MNARFEPPTIKERGKMVRATAAAMNHAQQQLERGQTAGTCTCEACRGTIRWSGNNGRSAGSCATARCVRWAT